MLLTTTSSLPPLTRENVPQTPQDLSKDFFTRVLASSLPSGVSLANVAVVRLGGEAGNTGAKVYRVALEYDGGGATSELPASLIVKLANTATMSSPTHRDSAFERKLMSSTGYMDSAMIALECAFYTKYQAAITEPYGIRTPKAYFIGMNGASTRFSRVMFIAFMRLERVSGCMVLEDLSQGRTYDAVEDVGEDAILGILSDAARLHGHTAKLLRESPTRKQYFKSMPYVYAADMVGMDLGITRVVKILTCRKGMARKVRQIWGKDVLSVLETEPDTFAALEALEKVFRSRVLPICEKRVRLPCVVHGDLHAGNYFFLPDGTRRMFDFQMYGAQKTGPIPFELAYFFSSNVAPDRSAEDKLLKAYHVELTACLGDDKAYPWREFRRDFDAEALNILVALMVRRSSFETPKLLDAQRKKHGKELVDGIQKVCTAREIRGLRRCAQLWRMDPTFSLALANYAPPQ